MKKIFFTLLFALGIAQLIPANASTPTTQTGQLDAAMLINQVDNMPASNMTTESFLNMSPKEFKKATGKKLNLKERIGLKLVQKALKKQMKAAGAGIDKNVYIILAIFIPFLAVGLATNFEGTDWLIALLLSFLFWLPGIIYAFIKMKDYYPS